MINAIADFFQSVFSPIVDVLGAVLLYFHQQLGLQWWISIMLLTVIVRTLLFPLTVRQVRSMRAMQELKPELDKLRNKYKDNRQKQQEEQMKLFQERKVNPLGGCLPILFQMPIIIGIFYAVRQFGGDPLRDIPPEYPSFRTGGLLWFQDLSVYDPYLILPILSAVTMLVSMEITNKSMEPQQRWLMRIMPIGITVFLWRFPAGLFVYWITSNMVTLVQNYVIYNFGPGKKKPAVSGESSVSDQSSPTGSGLSHDSHSEDPAKRAAKSAKRKRRKKKK